MSKFYIFCIVLSKTLARERETKGARPRRLRLNPAPTDYRQGLPKKFHSNSGQKKFG